MRPRAMGWAQVTESLGFGPQARHFIACVDGPGACRSRTPGTRHGPRTARPGAQRGGTSHHRRARPAAEHLIRAGRTDGGHPCDSCHSTVVSGGSRASRSSPWAHDILAYLDGAPAIEGLAVPAADLRLRAPVPRPARSCASASTTSTTSPRPGAPARVSRRSSPSSPTRSSADGEAIVIPAATNKADYEVELVAVIGRRAKHVSAGFRPRLRGRVHVRQRRQRPGPADEQPPVDARQGHRHASCPAARGW